MSSWSESTGTRPMAAVVPPAHKQIRFVNNEGRPPAKRRRVDAACQTCRKRKTRCDGKRPVCTTCEENRHECLGYAAAPSNLTTAKSPDIKRESIDDAAEDDEYEYSRDAKPKLTSPTKRRAETKADESTFEKRRSSGESSYDGHQPDGLLDSAPYNDNGQTSQPLNRRVPYFRWFGPTAIVRGFKQMVVSVREPRRSMGPTSLSSASPLSNTQSDGGDYKFSNLRGPSVSAGEARVMPELPSYDINDTAPVPSLIKHLVRTFFAHLGCNFPFLRKDKVLRMVEEKRLAPILVDAICSLAARFSDNDQLVSSQRTKQRKSEYGQVFAQRAKALVTDTFLCPTVEALQACLLLAYEAFGDDKDSALWMYTGCAIRMAFDLGLEKLDGIRIQRDLGSSYSPSGRDTKENNSDGRSAEATLQEQKASEQERIDTLWAIFTLDRFISSGLGRPATMRTEDFELRPPVITNNPETGWPAPLPALIQIIHMYGKVSDLLNSIKSEEDVTEEKIQGLADMEREMMDLYHSLDKRLTFKLEHFQHYVKAGEGTNFILLNLWFHTLIIVVHWPLLWDKAISKLLPNSNHKLSMSSAKTIADMLSCAETLDPKSFVGNPFTSQPTYFAASAFLMEANIYKASLPVSREGTPQRDRKYGDRRPPSASSKGTSTANEKDRQAETKVIAANQNYQRCYKALQQLETYWAGTKYILTALDQRAVGITDPEAFTSEEMESTKVRPSPAVQDWKRRLPTTPFAPPSPRLKSVALSISPKTERSASPMVDNGPTQPICWSLTGTTNSPSSNLTLMYQSQIGEAAFPSPAAPANRFYDPIRSSLPESVRAPSATATYSSYTTLNYHQQVAPQQPQPQIPMPPLMASHAGPKYSNIMDDPTALSDAKMLLELQHSPHPYNNRIGSASYVTTTSVQAPAVPAPQMQQDVYGGTPGYDFAMADQNNDMAYNPGWAMSGFIMPGGTGDMMLSTREIDMYDNEMFPWLAEVEYLPQDMMVSHDAAGNLGRYGSGGE